LRHISGARLKNFNINSWLFYYFALVIVVEGERYDRKAEKDGIINLLDISGCVNLI
jgi:hypothetical protein